MAVNQGAVEGTAAKPKAPKHEVAGAF